MQKRKPLHDDGYDDDEILTTYAEVDEQNDSDGYNEEIECKEIIVNDNLSESSSDEYSEADSKPNVIIHYSESDSYSYSEEEEMEASNYLAKKKQPKNEKNLLLKQDWEVKTEDKYDWMDKLESTNSKYEGVELLKEKIKIYNDFEKKAIKISKILVEELNKVNKVYQPINIGGQAGGIKYLVDGIFFKFQRDFKGIYGGDSLAMKAASHELRSAAVLFSQEFSFSFTTHPKTNFLCTIF